MTELEQTSVPKELRVIHLFKIKPFVPRGCLCPNIVRSITCIYKYINIFLTRCIFKSISRWRKDHAVSQASTTNNICIQSSVTNSIDFCTTNSQLVVDIFQWSQQGIPVRLLPSKMVPNTGITLKGFLGHHSNSCHSNTD